MAGQRTGDASAARPPQASMPGRVLALLDLPGPLVVTLRVDQLRRHLDAGDAGVDRNRIAGREGHLDGAVEQAFLGLIGGRRLFLVGQRGDCAGPFDEVQIGQFTHRRHVEGLRQRLGVRGADAAQGADGRVGQRTEILAQVILVHYGIDIHDASFQMVAGARRKHRPTAPLCRRRPGRSVRKRTPAPDRQRAFDIHICNCYHRFSCSGGTAAACHATTRRSNRWDRPPGTGRHGSTPPYLCFHPHRSMGWTSNRRDDVPTLDKPKILVVNDDANSLFALTSLLAQWAEQESYEVIGARSGEEGLRQVLKHDFAVILLDVNMPGMDGFETAEAIHQRARSADIPIIFITAFLADELDRLKAYQKGAVDFLFTPVIPQILYAKIAVFVALAMKNEELKQQARQLSQRTTELTATNARLTREIEERQVAQQQNHAKDEFLAMLGHELRNPLSAISSAASLIGLPGVSLDGVARARKIIQRQSQHLGRIVDDLLDLSRAMSGKILLNRAPLDLAVLLATCLETYQATGRTADYRFDIDLETGWIDADATRVEQIASNLIDNALKYTPTGGAIAVHCWAEDDEVLLTVRDSGVGIGADLLPHVFDVFVQGSRTLDRAQGGLGIGLSLVRRLAELHGGGIEAASAGVGTGSTFTLRLPRCAAPQAERRNPPLPQSTPQEKPSVLLIEDNDDGRSGLQLAVRLHPGLALVDIGLPGIDGYEVARRLRADPATRDMRLIALTGYGLAEDRRRVLEAGFDLHLVKPVEIEQLIEAIGSGAPLAVKP